MYEGMSIAGATALGGRRRRTQRGGGYYGAGGIDPITSLPRVGGRRTLKAKTLRRLLKKKGLKTTGKKSTLMKRLKMKGGGVATEASPWNGGWDRHGLEDTSYKTIRGS
jgi:hypothetical protein